MDNIFEFFNLVDGTYQEKEDPANLNQCFDLAMAYIDFLGIPREAIRHLLAAEIYTGANPLTTKYFDIIPNTPTGIPQRGDLVVWNIGYNGTSGHVGIAIGIGNTVSFECFVQNDPLKSPCHIKSYPTYDFVLGWLRPRILTTSTPPPVTDDPKDPQVCDKKSIRDKLVTKATSADTIGKFLNISQDDINSVGFADKVIAKIKQLQDIAFTQPSTPSQPVPSSPVNIQPLTNQDKFTALKNAILAILDQISILEVKKN